MEYTEHGKCTTVQFDLLPGSHLKPFIPFTWVWKSLPWRLALYSALRTGGGMGPAPASQAEGATGVLVGKPTDGPRMQWDTGGDLLSRLGSVLGMACGEKQSWKRVFMK